MLNGNVCFCNCVIVWKSFINKLINVVIVIGFVDIIKIRYSVLFFVKIILFIFFF